MDMHDKRLKSLARALRKNMTDAEQKLWYRVRRKQIHGAQFYRQKPLLNYIVDFYCASAKLVIEVDGGGHFGPVNLHADQERDQTLEERGLLVLRFDNHQVLTQTDAVLEEIYSQVGKRLNIEQE